MKKFLLSAFAATVTLIAPAQILKVASPQNLQEPENTAIRAKSFKEKFHIDELDSQKNIKINKYAMPEVTAAGDADGLITAPEGKTSQYAMSVDIFLSNMGSTHVGGFGAYVTVSEDNSSFYSKAFTLNFFQQGYSAGEIVGDEVIFHTGQYIYTTEDNEKAYMYAAYLSEGTDWPDVVDTFVLTKDENGRYVSKPNYFFIVMTEAQAELGINENTDIICFGTNYVFNPLPENIAEEQLPADAEVYNCQFFANSLLNYGDTELKDITVGVSGDKIYVGGLSDYLPGSYLVGTKNTDNSYTFNAHQYIGNHNHGDYPYIYEFTLVNPIYFDGESLYYQEAGNVTMSFNESKTLLTMEEGAGIFVCAYRDMATWNDVYWNVLIGDFNQTLTPQKANEVNFYGAYGGTPYIVFSWNNMSVEGLPLNTDNLWCEVVVNGETYAFSPEYYNGLAETTEKVYYNTSDVDGLYAGEYPTLYLYEYDDRYNEIKTIGVRIGYHTNDEIRYTDISYAAGFEPFEDVAFVPSKPSSLVYFKDYYNNIRFKFDGKDTQGNIIPERLLALEILLDGEPLVFKDSDYYFQGGDGSDVTMIGLSELAGHYSSSLVTKLDGEYILSLWGHSEIPEFKNLAVRPVCTGGNTITYGEICEIDLERAATPANPRDVEYKPEEHSLEFGAMPVDTVGNGVAPWNYGYEVYVNNSLYTFSGAAYGLENDITLIPYTGFEYNYNFYLHSNIVYDETDWSVIDNKTVMSVSMLDENLEIQKIGVRAVYTDGNGNTTCSDIVYSDGTVTGVSNIRIDNAPVKWFNMQGVEIAYPQAGGVYLRQQGGTTTKVLVK